LEQNRYRDLLKGDIDELRIWDKSQDEIRFTMNQEMVNEREPKEL
jgi:hypothetical protein